MPGGEELIDFLVSPAMLIELVSFDWQLSQLHMEWVGGIGQEPKMPSALALPSPPSPLSPVFQIRVGEGSEFRMFGMWSRHSAYLTTAVSWECSLCLAGKQKKMSQKFRKIKLSSAVDPHVDF